MENKTERILDINASQINSQYFKIRSNIDPLCSTIVMSHMKRLEDLLCSLCIIEPRDKASYKPLPGTGMYERTLPRCSSTISRKDKTAEPKKIEFPDNQMQNSDELINLLFSSALFVPCLDGILSKVPPVSTNSYVSFFNFMLMLHDVIYKQLPIKSNPDKWKKKDGVLLRVSDSNPLMQVFAERERNYEFWLKHDVKMQKRDCLEDLVEDKGDHNSEIKRNNEEYLRESERLEHKQQKNLKNFPGTTSAIEQKSSSSTSNSDSDYILKKNHESEMEKLKKENKNNLEELRAELEKKFTEKEENTNKKYLENRRELEENHKLTIDNLKDEIKTLNEQAHETRIEHQKEKEELKKDYNVQLQNEKKHIEELYNKKFEEIEKEYILKQGESDAKLKKASAAIKETGTSKLVSHIVSLIEHDCLDGASTHKNVQSLVSQLSKDVSIQETVRKFFLSKGVTEDPTSSLYILIQGNDIRLEEKINTIVHSVKSQTRQTNFERAKIAIEFALSTESFFFEVIDNAFINDKSKQPHCNYLFELNNITHKPDATGVYLVSTKGLAKLSGDSYVPYTTYNGVEIIPVIAEVDDAPVFEDILLFIGKIAADEGSNNQSCKSLDAFVHQAKVFSERELLVIKGNNEEIIIWAKKYKSLINDVFFRDYGKEFEKILDIANSGEKSLSIEAEEEKQELKIRFLDEWDKIRERLINASVKTYDIKLGERIDTRNRAMQGWDITIISDSEGLPDSIAHIDNIGIEVNGTTLIPPKIRVYGNRTKGTEDDKM